MLRQAVTPGGRDRIMLWLVPLLALAVSAPGLAFPFLSDDWALLDAVSHGRIMTSPLGDFRPLVMATYRLDLGVWGLRPWGFHITNVLLITVAAALLVRAASSWGIEARLAAMSGLVFALHPYHVENAAWVAARSAPLLAVCCLMSLIRFETWRASSRLLPAGALIWTEAALLSKETAVSLPLILLLRWFCLRRAPDSRRILLRGVLPVALLVSLHFLVVRPLALGGLGRTLGSTFGPAWGGNVLGMLGAAILPLDVEVLGGRFVPYGMMGLLAWLALMAVALAGRRPSWRIATWGMAAGLILLLPYAVGFEERYLFLPGAAFAVALAALVSGAPPLARRLVASGIVVVWSVCLVGQWRRWEEAARAGTALMDDLVDAAASPGIDQIVIANAPFRVQGGSVAGDFTAALAVLGARRIPVRSATWVSYDSAEAEALAGPPVMEVVEDQRWIRVPVKAGEEDWPRLVWPRAASYGATLSWDVIQVSRESPEVVRVGIQAAPGRWVMAWNEGRLIRIEGPGSATR
ncbi:MAG: hypothetical protein ACREAA_09025 [Candidatus Polarisedimenticolia bacterium]